MIHDSYPALTKVFDLTRQRMIFKLDGHETYVRALNFSPDGNILVSGSLDGTIQTWDMTQGTPIHDWPLLSGNNPSSLLRAIAVTSLGDKAVGGWWDEMIRMCKENCCEEIYTSGIPEDVAFSPDGDMCIAGLDSGTLLQIPDVETDQDSGIFVYRGHKLPDHAEVRIFQASTTFGAVQSYF